MHRYHCNSLYPFWTHSAYRYTNRMDLKQTKLAARAGIRALAERYRQQGSSPLGYSDTENYARETLPPMMVGRNLPLGSQIRTLGAGGEGISTQNLHPGAWQVRLREDPLAARKPGEFGRGGAEARTQAAALQALSADPEGDLIFERTQHPTMSMPLKPGSYATKIYDPTSGLYNPMIQKNRASLVGEEMPGYAKIHGFGQAGHNVAGLPTEAMISDFIPGKGARAIDRPEVAGMYHSPPAAMRARGLGAEDVRIGNTIKDLRTDKPTVIDYMPVAQRDRVPGFSPRPGMSHYVTEGIVSHSPTDRAFRYNTNRLDPTMAEVVGRYPRPEPFDPVRALLAKGPTAADKARQVAEGRARAKNYGSQLLKSFYTGKAPTPFVSKIPVPSTTDLAKGRAGDALAGLAKAKGRLMGIFGR